MNLFLFFASIAFLMIGLVLIWVSSFKIPDFTSFDSRKVASSTKIYDRTGEVLLYDIHEDVKRTFIPFEDMGVNIKNATVAIEDAEFYNHNGIRIKSIIRAFLANIEGASKTQGGSTITQQLVKNSLLTKKKTYTRKIKEVVLAIKIERTLPKEKILELYLNDNPYGGTIYGIEEASREYFGKRAYELSLAESAYLAAIPQAPTYYSPYGQHKEELDNRKNLVLFRMKELGFINEDEYVEAKEAQVEFRKRETKGIKAPHFVFFIKEYLEQKYGDELTTDGGFKVITTLDYSLQEKAEEIVKEGALKNQEEWGGSNAALVAVDPKTGQILTLVGSRDYFDTEIDGAFNVATALRQPGSSFKPFIYATAFNKGFTPETVLFDLPTEFQTTCNAYGKALPGYNQNNCYMPDNYDGKWRGPMSLRDALSQSINIPAVKLFYLAGLNDSLKTAEEMGITTLTDISRYGLTLVIGGGEVKLLDMVSAYGVFANNGNRNKHTGILKIEKDNGEVLEEYTQNELSVLPKKTALTISDILSRNDTRIPTFGVNSPLVVPGYEVAAKTGTTNSNRDAWLVGYSPNLVVGVWAGNNDNTPMKKGGSAMAGPIWNKFTSFALEKFNKEDFEKPNLETDITKTKPILRGKWQGNENFFVDKISGKLATELTPKETLEERVITNVHSILFWLNKNDITGDYIYNTKTDPQFNNWEIPVQDWWLKNRHKYQTTTLESKPVLFDDIHTPENMPKVLITNPVSGINYQIDEKIDLKTESLGKYPVVKMDVIINGSFVDTLTPPFIFSFTPGELDNLNNPNELKLIVYDSVFNRAEVVSVFNVIN